MNVKELPRIIGAAAAVALLAACSSEMHGATPAGESALPATAGLDTVRSALTPDAAKIVLAPVTAVVSDA